MTTLASARSTERPTSTRLLAIAKVVGVVVALGYLAVNAIGLWWMRGYQITWTWVGVLGWILPPAAAVIALAWPRAGGVAFLLAAGLELYQQINLYVSAQGEEWQ
ncbi:MAG TPA: hypothetical protein VI814_11045, partial [Candidatus Limnocylindria bacterium]